MKTYTRGISIRKFDALVVALSVSGVSKFEISRTCQQLDEQVIAVLGRLLNHAHFLNVYLGLHLPERLHGQNMLEASWVVVVAIEFNIYGCSEMLGSAVVD